MASKCGNTSKSSKNQFVLPPIEDAGNKGGSAKKWETFSLVTSGSTLSPEMYESDSELEEMAFNEEEQQDVRSEDAGRKHDDESQGIRLSSEAEREIKQRAKEGLKKELRKIEEDARARRIDTRKRFKAIIDDARSQLISTRIEAEKVSINKLEEEAEKQQARILKERAQRKKEEKVRLDGDNDYSKAQSVELASLRKIQADLDRARARRKHSLAAALTTVNGKAKVSNLLQREVKRLERAEEVQKIIVELYSLGLTDTAIKLTHALSGKEQSENELRTRLRDDQIKARRRTLELMEGEIVKVRMERLSEMEKNELEGLRQARLEEERREKEKREKRMAALKELARNMEKNKLYKQSLFNTSVSRQFSFSYFPSLKK